MEIGQQLIHSMFPAIEELARCPDIEYRNRHGHLTFHPLAVYNISRSKCLRHFRRVIEELDSKKTCNEYIKQMENLLNAYEALLHALASHWDDCFSIVRSISLASTESTNFEKSLKDSLEHHFEARVRLPINQIKHHTHRISAVVYYDAEIVVPGFFFIAPVAPGVAGPSPLVHKDGIREYSFSLTLRKLFFGLHQVSVVLKDVIRNILPSNASAVIPSNSNDSETEMLVRLGTWFASSLRCRFPGEDAEAMPDINLENNRFVFRPKGLKRVLDCRNRSMQVTVAHHGDGVTRTFKVPGAG